MTKIGFRLAIITALGLMLVFPAFLSGIFVGHDSIVHINWSRFFSQQLWSGDLYPRWLADMNGGRGSPVFFFYGPAPYYLNALLEPLLGREGIGWLPLGGSFSLALIGSGISAYFWLRDFTDDRAAFLAALFYMLLPYHLAVDFLFRFAYAEFWSFAWMPLVLLSTRRLLKGEASALATLALSYALLLTTHLPTAMIFSPVPFFYALVFGERGSKTAMTTRVIMAMGLAMGLAAIYLFPALSTQKNIMAHFITEGRYFYQHAFLFLGQLQQPETYRGFWLFLSWMTVIAGFTVLCCFAAIGGNHKEKTFWLVAAMLSTFMMFEASDFVWKLLPTLQRIQFPWRFNVLLSLAGAALLSLMVDRASRPGGALRRSVFMLACALVCGQALGSAFLVYERGRGVVDPELKQALLSGIAGAQGAPEYLPRWVPESLAAAAAEGRLGMLDDRIDVLEGRGRAEIVAWEPGKIVLDIEAASSLELAVGQFYYPGWTARTLSDSAILPVKPARDGLVGVAVPPGAYSMAITMSRGPEERMGQIVSAFCLVLLGVLSWRSRRRRQASLTPGQRL